jgi:5-methylcytosine-specific restriction endonuclease McrA
MSRPSGFKLTQQHKISISNTHKKAGIKPPSMKGKKWRSKKDGYITPIKDRITNGLKYKQWRQSVFIKDCFTCQVCGKSGGNDLQAHHKKSMKTLIEEVLLNLPLYDLYDGAIEYTPMWDVDNGITLCEKCHRNIHIKER